VPSCFLCAPSTTRISFSNPMNDSRPTALVTGASAGIGLELARILAREGHDLVLVARNAAKLQQLAAELEQAHSARITVIVADLSQPGSPDRVWQKTQEAGVSVDVLVNNAGFGQFGAYANLDLSEELRQLQVNIVSLTHLTKLYLRPMLERRRGRILNVASTAAFQPGPLMAVYYASKAYVLSFSEGIANELRGTGVTVTCLCPGPTTSEFHERAGMKSSNMMKAPFMTAHEVAEIGYRAMSKGKPSVIAGRLNWLAAQSTRLAPRSWAAAIARKVQES
jgi:short-subunit dehydrogenase